MGFLIYIVFQALKRRQETVNSPRQCDFFVSKISLFLSDKILVQKDNLLSMIGSAANTIPKGNTPARFSASFELPITLLIRVFHQKEQKMTTLTIFNFENTQIQTIVENNEVFFRAAQLAELLQYRNPHDAIKKHVDTDDLAKREVMNSVGKKTKAVFVNESGMYALILGSKMESAKKVKRWVTAEVLPAIRKTGKFEVAQTTAEDRTGLRDAVNFLVSKRGLLYSDAYNLVHQRFNVKSIEDLSLEQLPQAIEYVHKIALEGELIAPPRDTSQMVKIPHAGRWLVITSEYDENRTVVKNIDGKSCVDARLNRKLISETHLMADMLLELAHRMRIVDGECNPNIFDTPILQSKRKTII